MLPLIAASLLQPAPPRLIYPTRPHIVRPTARERAAFDPSLASVGIIASARRRSGAAPYDPTPLYASGELGDWWVFDNVHTNQPTVGSHITQATGLANSHVMTTPGAGPTLALSSGGYNAGFSGSTTRMLYNFGSNLTQPGTIIICVNDGETATHVIATGSSSSLRWQISDQSSGTIIGFSGTTLDSLLAENFGTKVFTVEFNGSSGVFRSNGTQLASGNIGTGATDQLTVGSSFDGTFPGNFRIFAIMIINRLLTTGTGGERDLAERAMGAYAGLSW